MSNGEHVIVLLVATSIETDLKPLLAVLFPDLIPHSLGMS